MDDFPSNSRRPVNQDKAASSENRPKLSPVVTGPVISRKKPIGRRLKDMLFAGDGVIGYLGKEVLVPALQDLLIDTVKQGIEKAVYGEVRSPRSTGRNVNSVTRPYISYNRPGSVTPSSPPMRAARRSPSAFELHEVIVSTKAEAMFIRDKLAEQIQDYGSATVANLYELVEKTPAYTDHKYGWMDLDGFEIHTIREGYLLQLPDPEDLRQ